MGSQVSGRVRAWERSWSEVVPFLGFPTPIRKIISTTNAIESLKARYGRPVNACGHFRYETAALKRLYLTTLALDPTGRGRKWWTRRWKEVMNAFDIAFDGQLSAERAQADQINGKPPLQPSGGLRIRDTLELVSCSRRVRGRYLASVVRRIVPPAGARGKCAE
ncbi:transposase [Streptomyces sp. NBRC 110611]|nr:transposase [Streptomyces sp. NBRC 110611]